MVKRFTTVSRPATVLLLPSNIMSTNEPEPPDPEDMFNDTRMSVGDHIEDLRTHLLRALKGFLIGMVLGFWPLGQIVLGIIVDPVEEQLARFEERKLGKELIAANDKVKQEGLSFPAIDTVIDLDKQELEEGLQGKPRRKRVLDKMTRGFERVLRDLDALDALEEDVLAKGTVIRVHAQIADPMSFGTRVLEIQTQVRRPKLSTMHITEAFMVYFKVAMMTGLVISSPWVFYHIWMFIAAGLYPHEKKLVHLYLPFSLFLFIGGVFLCQYMVMPKAIEAMLWFNEWLGLSADLRLNEWLGFALMMPIVFGASFQTPLVMMFLHRVGILTIQNYRDYRRISWFVMAIFAAIITPSVDAVSMLFLWLPMIGLYEFGILLCIYQGEREEDLAEWEKEEKANELVEV